MAVQYINAKSIEKINVYHKNSDGRFCVVFVDDDGKTVRLESTRAPLLSLAHPDDTLDGYARLGRLFAEADMRNIPRDSLFQCVKGASIAYRANLKRGFF